MKTAFGIAASTAIVHAITDAISHAAPQPVTAEDLRWSAAVAQQLTNRGIDILSAHHNGRCMVLHVERDPNFEGIRGGMIRRQPAPGGMQRVYALQHLGVQVQWTAFEQATQEVANG